MKFLILLALVGLALAGKRSPLLPSPLTRKGVEMKLLVGTGQRSPLLPNPLARKGFEIKVRAKRSPLLPNPLARKGVEIKVQAMRSPLLPNPLARKGPEIKATSGYIVGGVAATSGQVPYIVSLQRTSHFCGGTIVAPSWILTAAHCVSGVAASSLNIRYNSLNHNEGGSLVKASAVYVHENYDSWTINNDVALIKLTAPLTLGQPNAQKVALPAQGSDVAAGDVTISGWGHLAEGGGVLPSALQTLNVASVDRATCNTAYNGEITEQMFCAGVLNVGGKDACQGDSGGPVIQNGAVVGAVSWGYGCARPDHPGVYTRIGSFVEWISSKGFNADQ